jgi:hypothetical protein
MAETAKKGVKKGGKKGNCGQPHVIYVQVHAVIFLSSPKYYI